MFTSYVHAASLFLFRVVFSSLICAYMISFCGVCVCKDKTFLKQILSLISYTFYLTSRKFSCKIVTAMLIYHSVVCEYLYLWKKEADMNVGKKEL